MISVNLAEVLSSRPGILKRVGLGYVANSGVMVTGVAAFGGRRRVFLRNACRRPKKHGEFFACA